MNAVFRVSCFVAVVAAASVSYAASITLTPTDDCYIRTGSGEANSPHDGSPIIVATSAHRTGLLQFDLSSVPGTITGAKLRLNADEDGADLNISGWLFPNTASFPKMDETNMTRDLFISDYLFDEIGPRDLGTFSIVNSVTGQYYDSLDANASDVAILNSIRTQSLADDRHVIIEVYAEAGGMDFRSKEAGLSVAPQLVLEYVPEPSTLALVGLAIFSVPGVLTRNRLYRRFPTPDVGSHC